MHCAQSLYHLSRSRKLRMDTVQTKFSENTLTQGSTQAQGVQHTGSARFRAPVCTIDMEVHKAYLSEIGNLHVDLMKPLNIAEAGLHLAVFERPTDDINLFLPDLDNIVEITRRESERRQPKTLSEKASVLRSALYGRARFLGDNITYHDPRNANMMNVLERKRGLPAALGILYIHAARAQDWGEGFSIYGVNYPKHFLLALEQGDERIYIDPFRGGLQINMEDRVALRQRFLGEQDDCPNNWESVGDIRVLLRLQSYLMQRYRQDLDLPRALGAAGRMALMAPQLWSVWVDLGKLHYESGNVRASLWCAEVALELDLPEDAATSLDTWQSQIRRTLN